MKFGLWNGSGHYCSDWNGPKPQDQARAEHSVALQIYNMRVEWFVKKYNRFQKRVSPRMAELELEQLRTQSLELKTALAKEQQMSAKAAKMIEMLAEDQKYEINVETVNLLTL